MRVEGTRAVRTGPEVDADEVVDNAEAGRSSSIHQPQDLSCLSSRDPTPDLYRPLTIANDVGHLI